MAHLTRWQREQLQALSRAKQSQRAIAKILRCHPSTVSRELARNSTGPARRYTGHIADARARERRSAALAARPQWVEDLPLLAEVETELTYGRTPDQIAGRLRQNGWGHTVSHETIYAYALTNGRDEQLLVVPASAPKLMTAAACTPIVVGTSSSACRFGTSGAAVETIPGATYAWTVDGAAITGGDGTNRITLAFGAASSATVTVAVHTPDGCTRNGAASISLRDPFRIGSLVAPATTIGDPVTIAWAIAGSDVPRSQTLTINGTPVKIAVTDRSYTFTPTAIGSYSVQLDASLIGGRRRACCRSGDYPIASFCGADSRTVSFSVTPPCEPTTATLSSPSSVTQGATLTGSVTANGSWTLTSALGNPIAPASGNGSRAFTYSATTTGNDTLTLRVTGECSTVTRTASVAVSAPPLQVHLSADSYIVPFHSSTKLHVVVDNAPPGGFGYVLHSSGGNSCDLITIEGNDSLTYRYTRDNSVSNDTVTITVTYNGQSATDSIVIIPNAPCTTTPVLSNVSVSPSVISQGQTAMIHFTVSGQGFGYWSLKSELTNTVTPDAGSQTGTFTVTYDGGRARGADKVRIYAQDQAGTCAVWTDVTITVQ